MKPTTLGRLVVSPNAATRPWIYVVQNVAAYVVAAVAGAVVSSSVAFASTDYGTVSEGPIGAILAGALFLLAVLTSVGTPIALAVIATTWWWSGRGDVPRWAVVALTCVAGMVWLGIFISPALANGYLPFTSVVAVSLLAPWLLFGLALRLRRFGAVA